MAFLGKITVRERGNAPRGMRKAFREAQKAAWLDTATEFDTAYRDKRFTVEHAREAGYAARKGELLPRDSKAFRRSYAGQKLRIKKHQRPLEFSGDTRKALRRGGKKSSTSTGGKVSYRGARRFNFRHPKSKIRMSEEFTRITRRETEELAQFFDRRLDFHLAQQDR